MNILNNQLIDNNPKKSKLPRPKYLRCSKKVIISKGKYNL